MTPLFVFMPSHPVDGPAAKRISDAIIASGIDTHGPDIRIISRYFHWGGRPDVLDELQEFTSILHRVKRSQFYSVWREIARLAEGAMVIPPRARKGRPPGGSLPVVHVIPDSVRDVLPELLALVPARPFAQTAWADIINCDNAGTVSLLPRRGDGVGTSADGHRIPGAYVMRLLGPLAQARLPHLSAENAIGLLRSDPVLGRHPLVGIHPTSKFPLTETYLEPLNTLSENESARLTRALVSVSTAIPRAVQPVMGMGTSFGGAPAGSLPPSWWPAPVQQPTAPAPAPLPPWAPVTPSPAQQTPWVQQPAPAPAPQQPVWQSPVQPATQQPPVVRAPEAPPGGFWRPTDDDDDEAGRW